MFIAIFLISGLRHYFICTLLGPYDEGFNLSSLNVLLFNVNLHHIILAPWPLMIVVPFAPEIDILSPHLDTNL